ncbi:hypothetical protein IFR09_11550 [Pseudomonas syringae]|nr:hypothetical protein [Pseudomonas syringae]MBD8801852.1 hypothetical protein [Pseudomonas syringae]MBD8811798.1 hypothetical protein [Pseudomonas syringae]
MFEPKDVDPDMTTFTWSVYHCRKDPSAEDYLEYARLDLADGTEPRNLINALANAKRALHMRMEDLCLGFGCVSLNRVKNFHSLSEYILKCGLPSPSVLEKFNKLRNVTEHSYEVPSLEMVEIYTGVAYLFLSATDRWSLRHPCDIDTSELDESGTKQLRQICFNWGKGEVTLRISDTDSKHYEFPHSITYTNKDKEFFDWVAFAVKHSS